MTLGMTAGDPSVLAVALDWLRGTLLGALGTSVAVLTVASVGFLMVTGRVDVRRAGQVILGCFILFGASTIASGILAVLQGKGNGIEPPMPVSAPLPDYPVAPPATQGSPSVFDPYAGAALPQRQ